MASFNTVKVFHIARTQNRHADSLATLASSVNEEIPRQIKVELISEPSVDVMNDSGTTGINVTAITTPAPCWIDTIADFLADDQLPSDEKEGIRIRRMASRYWLSEDRTLYRRSFGGPYLLCLRPEKIVIPSSSTIRNGFSILHQVPEGHVGVYWRGGALLEMITDPGFHLKLPLITHYEPVQVTLQTDQVRDIPCGTKGGVLINFEKIEVVNRLHKDYVHDTLLNYGVQYDHTWIYDKIHHEINQFCSSHSLQQVYIDVFDQIDEKMKDALQGDCTRYSPGIEIISVRVTKPKIPESIRRNFEQMEEERTKVLIAIEKQRVVEKEAETNKKMAISEAEKVANVSKILMEQKLMEKDSVRKQQEIENQIYMSRQKSLADADFYRLLKEAEANNLKLTPQFLELKFIEAIADNTKIFFGEKIPNMFLDQRLLGNFLQQLSRNVSEEEKSTA